MDEMKIIEYFYPEDTPLRQLLLKHSCQVRDKALEILAQSGMTLDKDTVTRGAMLHDIGIIKCSAPGILCKGFHPYITHGKIGADMLRQYAEIHGLELETFARICERLTGRGLSADSLRKHNRPLPDRDFLPETAEEKLICLADKFFSKSGNMEEKPVEKVFHSMDKFGPEAVTRLEELFHFFNLATGC